MEYDYILQNSGLFDETHALLEKIAGDRDKILSMDDFCALYLNVAEQMEYLKQEKKLLHSQLGEHYEVGDFTYLHDIQHSFAHDKAKVVIGKYCSISYGLRIVMQGDHRKDWNTTYPFNVFLPAYHSITGHPYYKGNIVIGNDVWIGAYVTLLAGVKIGDGAIIGAGAVVVSDIPPYSIAVGTPAKVIKRRFADETIAKLQEMEWWNWEDEEVCRAVPLLQSDRTDELYEYWKELKSKKNEADD